jgi:hypothetical protein
LHVDPLRIDVLFSFFRSHPAAFSPVHALSSFGGRGWMSRAALLKTAHWAVFALSSATAPQLFESTRKARSKRV